MHSHEKLVKQLSTARLPTAYGEFTALVYENILDKTQHFVLVKGEVKEKKQVLVRVHSECLTGDVFHSIRCDCGPQLNHAIKKIAEEGEGVLVYLRGQEGRGIGLSHKLEAYQLQDQGYDTVEANLKLGFPIDSRDYHIAAQILSDLGLSTIRLMTNNPDKSIGLANYGLSIEERIPLIISSTKESWRYLQTKKEKMGHLFD